MNKRQDAKRRELFDAQDAIAQQRESLTGKSEKQLKHNYGMKALFAIRWRMT